jgi:hypothetical protein
VSFQWNCPTPLKIVNSRQGNYATLQLCYLAIFLAAQPRFDLLVQPFQALPGEGFGRAVKQALTYLRILDGDGRK